MPDGEIDTSLLPPMAPDPVRDGPHNAGRPADDRRRLHTGLQHRTRSGVIGRPSPGTAEKGRPRLTRTGLLVQGFASVPDLLGRPRHRPERPVPQAAMTGAALAPDSPLCGRRLAPERAREHPWPATYWETIDHILEHDETVARRFRAAAASEPPSQ